MAEARYNLFEAEGDAGGVKTDTDETPISFKQKIKNLFSNTEDETPPISYPEITPTDEQAPVKESLQDKKPSNAAEWFKMLALPIGGMLAGALVGKTPEAAYAGAAAGGKGMEIYAKDKSRKEETEQRIDQTLAIPKAYLDPLDNQWKWGSYNPVTKKMITDTSDPIAPVLPGDVQAAGSPLQTEHGISVMSIDESQRLQQSQPGQQISAPKQSPFAEKLRKGEILSIGEQAELLDAQEADELSALDAQAQNVDTSMQRPGESVNQFKARQQNAFKTIDRIRDQATKIKRTYAEKRLDLQTEARKFRHEKEMVGARTQAETKKMEVRKRNKIEEMKEAQALRVKFDETRREQMKRMPSAEWTKVATLAASGKRAIDKLKTLLKEDPDPWSRFSMVGDNPYTAARLMFTEAIGRLHSGGAISEDESQRFKKMVPTVTDTNPETIAYKIKELEAQFDEAITLLGANKGGIAPGQHPKDMGEQDKKAMDWLLSHPEDPRASAVEEKLRSKGFIK